jgi:hypothetical protein
MGRLMIRNWRLPDAVLARIPPEAWQPATPSQSDDPDRWVPMIRLSHDKWLGATPDGNWAVGQGDRARRLQEGWHVPLLPLLESPYVDWRDHLSELRDRAPEWADAIENVVQVGPLVSAAINGEGHHWPGLAVAWLEQSAEIPRPLEALKRLAESGSRAPQQLRHRARALLAAEPGVRDRA